MPVPSKYNLEHFNFCNRPLSVFYAHGFFLLSLLQSQKPHEITLLEEKISSYCNFSAKASNDA